MTLEFVPLRLQQSDIAKIRRNKAIWVRTGKQLFTENSDLQPDPQRGGGDLQPEEFDLQRGWRKGGKMKVDEEDVRFLTTELRKAS